MGQPTVQITHLENIEWLNGTLCRYDPSSTNHIWRIRISLFTSLINDLWVLLTADEQERAGRYHREKDKDRFIISRAALRILLGKYLNIDARQIIFELGQNQKPHVKGNNSIHYNVSHSGDLVLIAFSNTEVGVDVEQHDTHLHYPEIMQISYSNAEIELVERSIKPIKLFYLLWTRKEAFLKAIGKGIDDDLKQVPSLNGVHTIDQNVADHQSSLLVRSFTAAPGYSGSIASYFLKDLFWDMPTQFL